MKAAMAGTQLAMAKGRYIRWASPSGAELWLQVHADGALIGVTPYFSGTSAVHIRLTAAITQPDDATLDGAFHCWADPREEDSESGLYPFVFDAPDFHLYPPFTFPCIAQAQIAAFPHEVEVYGSPEEFSERQSDTPAMASQAFIPTGLFSDSGERAETPMAYAILSGHVITSETRRNELGGAQFHWAMIESFGGTYDVVIDPQQIPALPQPGAVISGSFWLSGRLTSYPKPATGWFSRHFRRS